jgi:photosystem II stability/assembly factor-like uncharacterized protein
VSTWQRLSKRPGGTVAGFACAGEHVFAAAMAGVFRSSDGGTSWNATSVHAAVPFCEAIVAPTESVREQLLFVGGRNGLHRSEDHGTTWVQALSGGRVLSIAMSRDVLLIGTEQDGILRSGDGGHTFAGANAGLTDLTVLTLALSPDFERDGTGFAATLSGLYRTRNAGKSWRALDFDTSVQCLSVSPRFGEDRIVLAGTESDGLLRSDDGGAHWSPVSDLRDRSVTAIVFSTRTIAVATDVGVAISADGGVSWRMTAADVGPVLALTITRTASGDVLLAGLHRNGVARAAEPFDCWTTANNGLHARVLLGLAFSPDFEADQTLFAAGPDDGVLVSTDAGRTWRAHLIGAGDAPVFAVQPSRDFARDRTLFTATQDGVLVSRDAGDNWQPLGLQGEGRVIINGSSLFAALRDGRLLRSEDAGESWRSVAGFDAEIIALARATDGTLFVGTRTSDQVTLWRSSDGGRRWERWLVERSGEVVSVAVSPGYDVDQTVYVGIGSSVLTPIRNTREVRSDEQRPMWRRVDLSASITALATPEDSRHSGAVFAATSRGVYVSRDRGERFTHWDEGGGPLAAVAIAVSSNYAADRLVYAVELGGGIWCRRVVP